MRSRFIFTIDLPVLNSILIKGVRWSFIQTCLGNFYRFISVQLLWSILIDRVEFYPDLSLEISIDLPVSRSILINRFKFYPDLSLEMSIKLPVFKGHAVLINRVKFNPKTSLWKVPYIYQSVF